MASHDLTYANLFSEALTVSRRAGTWVLYAIQNAQNIDHLVGYLRYRIDDFRRRERQALEAGHARRKEALATRAAYYARACRLVMRLGRGDYRKIAKRLIRDLKIHPEYKKLPYVAKTEVTGLDGLGGEGRRWKLDEEPRRPGGRPPTRVRAIKLKPCEACDGMGLIP